MTTFGEPLFPYTSYASCRPVYPKSLYEAILAYTTEPRSLCADLGTGHGIIVRALAPYFEQAVGIDRSSGMLECAKATTATCKMAGKIKFLLGVAEDLSILQTGTVDLVVAGQAAHWFDQSRFWPEMERLVRKGGVVALWGYHDYAFVDYPEATKILNEYSYGADKLGPYWMQPGRSVLQNYYRDVLVPEAGWEDIQRMEREASSEDERGAWSMGTTMKVKEHMDYLRTWSAFHSWCKRNPTIVKKMDGGQGDIVDNLFNELRTSIAGCESNEEVWLNKELRVEWGTVLLLARRS